MEAPRDFCANCGKDNERLLYCSRCKVAGYCNVSCQREAWRKGHKSACEESPEPVPARCELPFLLLSIHNVTAKYCFMYTKGLASLGLPEILAVDVEVGALTLLKGVINTVGEHMVSEGNNYSTLQHPDGLVRRNSWGHDANSDACLSYFAEILVTNPDHLRLLFRKFVRQTMFPASAMSRLVVLMPICQGKVWGQLPPAPEGKVKLRNDIKKKFAASREFLRAMDGNKLNAHPLNWQKVKLEDALPHCDDWVVDWDADMSATERQYVVDHREHFIGMSLDGVSRARADAYVDRVARVNHNALRKYKRKIGE